MNKRILIALAAATGLALTGCSHMKSADNDQSTNGTMRRADAGQTSSPSTSESPTTTETPAATPAPDNSASSTTATDCADPANKQKDDCTSSRSDAAGSNDPASPNTSPR